MRNLLLIAKREYLATVRTKAFIIGLIIAPIFMGGSIIGMALLGDKVDTTDRTISVIDHTGQIADYLIEKAETRNQEEVYDDEGNKKKPVYLLETLRISPEQDLRQLRLELSDQIRNGELYGFLEIGENIINPPMIENSEGELEIEKSSDANTELQTSVALYSKNPALDDLRGWVRGHLNDRVREIRLTQLGVDTKQAESIFLWHGVEGMELVEADESGEIKDAKRANEIASLAVPGLMTLFMFMLVMMGAMPLLNSVMEEKNQHIAETLLSSVTPFEFMFGKVLGGVAISLTGSGFYIAGTLFTLGNMGLMGYVPISLIPWFLIYNVLAILMMGSIMAAIGSACTDVKESQNLTLPAMLPIMIPMFVMMPVIKEPMSGFATTLSLIPPFTPMLMMLRQAVPGGVPFWQPLLGLALLILFTVISIWVGSRIFRVAILLKGKTPHFGTLIKWAIKG